MPLLQEYGCGTSYEEFPGAESTSATPSMRAGGRRPALDTATVATASDRHQPSTSNSPNRNSAALDVAESGSRAMFGRIRTGFFRVACARPGSFRRRLASAVGPASTAIGTRTMKIELQESAHR